VAWPIDGFIDQRIGPVTFSLGEALP